MHSSKLCFECRWPGNFRHPALQGLYLRRDKPSYNKVLTVPVLNIILVVIVNYRGPTILPPTQGADQTWLSWT